MCTKNICNISYKKYSATVVEEGEGGDLEKDKVGEYRVEASDG